VARGKSRRSLKLIEACIESITRAVESWGALSEVEAAR
jgi:hypothetical protein